MKCLEVLWSKENRNLNLMEGRQENGNTKAYLMEGRQVKIMGKNVSLMDWRQTWKKVITKR